MRARGHSEWFWYFWAKAGGDVESYICNNIPTQTLTSALVLTVTLASLLETPSVFEDIDPENDGLKKAYNAFTFLMFTSTMMNMCLIFIGSVFLEHYHSCSNYETKLNYCGQFGWVVALCYGLLNRGFLSMMSAILLKIYHSTNGQTCYICIGLFSLAYFGIFYMSSAFPRWNHTNYMPSVSTAARKVAPMPPLAEALQRALKTTDCATKVLDILQKHGCEDTHDLVEYISDNALAPSYTPGVGRFSHALVDLGIGGFDANQISHYLKTYLDQEDWNNRAGEKEIDGSAAKKASQVIGGGDPNFDFGF